MNSDIVVNLIFPGFKCHFNGATQPIKSQDICLRISKTCNEKCTLIVSICKYNLCVVTNNSCQDQAMHCLSVLLCMASRLYVSKQKLQFSCREFLNPVNWCISAKGRCCLVMYIYSNKSNPGYRQHQKSFLKLFQQCQPTASNPCVWLVWWGKQSVDILSFPIIANFDDLIFRKRQWVTVCGHFQYWHLEHQIIMVV